MGGQGNQTPARVKDRKIGTKRNVGKSVLKVKLMLGTGAKNQYSDIFDILAMPCIHFVLYKLLIRN